MMKNYDRTNHDQVFDRWNNLKKSLDINDQAPGFGTGEIWWCSIGKNIGVEIFGKSKKFSRPVLVFKKFNQYSFFGIPLTSKVHNDRWHTNFVFRGKSESAVLSQARVISSARLIERIGRVGDNDYQNIRKDLYGILFESR